MPYIVTTRRPNGHPESNEGYTLHVAEHAVATLQDAALYIDETTFVVHRPSQIAIPESGGTVGPLPDGTVIEVRRVTWARLAYDAGFDDDRSDPLPGDQADILDAFNAR